MINRFAGWMLCLGVLATAARGEAQDQVKKTADVFTTEKEAGPDFQIQGEYEGEIVDVGKYGAQVVALGDGKFDVYFLPGGLPGAGWDTQTRIKIPAQTDAGQTRLNGNGWSGAIGGGKLTGQNDTGKAFSLQKVKRQSPTLGAKPPQGALILFDGGNADAWQGGKIVEENLLYCGTRSKEGTSTGKYHFEFRTPFRPKARGQGRGNSGVYILGREIQVLDSFGLTGEKNECGAYYGQAKPAVNMCYPPLSWQTYDVEIKPSDKPGTLLSTVWHNGVKIHDNFPLNGTPDKKVTINLQNHGNPVVFRNIWYVPDAAARQ
ncbi:MAG: DUF1080 domain-containing protein [Gemmataceae bacterium]